MMWLLRLQLHFTAVLLMVGRHGESESNDVPLLLDLAQHAAKTPAMESLSASDAAVISFGIGKGVDTGGGLLIHSDAFIQSLPVAEWKILDRYTPLFKSAILRLLIAAGLYRFFLPMLDRRIEDEKDERTSFAESFLSVTEKLYPMWAARLAKFSAEVELAKCRSEKNYQNVRHW